MILSRREAIPSGQRIVILWGSRETHEVCIDTHGGVSISRLENGEAKPLGYVYPNEAVAISDALAILVAENKANKLNRHAEFENKIRIDKSRVFYDEYSVDLSPSETFEALTLCKFRKIESDWQIYYSDSWLKLVRTDLKDNVCTNTGRITSPAEFRDMIQYGARILLNSFAVVDSYSDG